MAGIHLLLRTRDAKRGQGREITFSLLNEVVDLKGGDREEVASQFISCGGSWLRRTR